MEEAHEFTPQEGDAFPQTSQDNIRTRKLTEKGEAYRIETLRSKRNAINIKLRNAMKIALESLRSDAVTLESLEASKYMLDNIKESLNEAHNSYDELLESKEDKDNAYKWFDQRDREYEECRMRVTERIQALERKFQNPSIVYSRRSHSKRSGSERSSNYSAQSRRTKAAAKAAKLRVEMAYLEKESEIKRIQLDKELALATAEENAMRKIVEEDSIRLYSHDQRQQHDDNTEIKSTKHEYKIPNIRPSVLNYDCEPVVQVESQNLDALKPEQSFEGNKIQNTVIKPKSQANVQTNNISRDNKVPSVVHYSHSMQMNAPVNDNHPSEVNYNYAPNRFERDVLSMQMKQTELSALLVEQQRLGTLPIKEPPTFDGNYFDYPMFIEAFEMIIERRTVLDRDRLFFLNKYTTGKANEVIQGFVVSNAMDSYKRAKELLSKRFGDPYRISEAYKNKLKTWPAIRDGDSTGYLEFSDFLKRCHETMNQVQYMDDLNSSEMLKSICGKLPTYSSVRWCRCALEIRRNCNRSAQFEDLLKFVSDEAELATDPVFSPDEVKCIRKKIIQDTKQGKRLQGTSNSFDTVTSELKYNKSVQCPKCNKTHELNSCQGFKQLVLNDRLLFVKTNKLCFGCLRPGHISKNCKKKLICEECKQSHPTSLHDPKRNLVNSNTVDEISEDKTKKSESTINRCSNIQKRTDANFDETSAMILPVWLYHCDNPERKVKVYALMDNASDSTFVKTTVLEELCIKGTDIKLDLFTMSGKIKISAQKVHGLVVSRLDNQAQVSLPPCYSRDLIPVRKTQIPRPEMTEQWSHLHKIKEKLTPFDETMNVGILIGCNCPKAIKPQEVITGNEDDPYAIRSLLGWGIIGPIGQKRDPEGCDSIVSNRIVTQEIVPSSLAHTKFVLSPQVKEVINPVNVIRMFELDFSEIKIESEVYSKEEKKFLKQMEEGVVHREDQHYELPLPLREVNLRLPDNRLLAIRRLHHLKKRLDRDKSYNNDYVAFMDNLIVSGHAERVPEDEVVTNDVVWYIPHHGIYHPTKGKFRVVFDCSCEYNGESLNKNLLPGPDLTNKLIGVLCRFRKESVGVICDIEGMFHQVKVTVACRNLLRFLWWTGGDTSRKPDVYRMTVHLFGATSSPACSNFALKRTADDNEGEFGSGAAEFVRKDFYVDDGLKSFQSTSQAISMIKAAKEMCQKGGFKLHKFISNRKEVIEAIPFQDRAEKIRNLDLDTEILPVERVLGIEWCTERDEFQFQLVMNGRPDTRRGILSTISCIYDPLGFIAPVILTGKHILQMLCKDKADWDTPIPDELAQRWQRWLLELPLLKSFTVKRCFKPENFGNIVQVQLHSFSDASTTGYGQCTYLRLKDSEGNIHNSLVMAKSRVTPLKMITIPRLELTAALMSVKISNQLKAELKYENVEEFFWCDSQAVLRYVANESRKFHVFVANRVQQIQDLTFPYQWRYINGKINPADIASRGISAKELIQCSEWINGPEFLWNDHEEWNTPDLPETQLPNDDPEMKKSVSLAVKCDEVNKEVTLQFERFSNWQGVKRAVVWCKRYIQSLFNSISCANKLKGNEKLGSSQKDPKGKRCTKLLKEQDSHSKSAVVDKIEPITVQEMEEAGLPIIKLVQKEHMCDEIKLFGTVKNLSGRQKSYIYVTAVIFIALIHLLVLMEF